MKFYSSIFFFYLFIIGVSSAQDPQVLPIYSTDFETTEEFQNNWYTTSDSIVIIEGASHSGSTSSYVQIPSANPENFISLGFNPPESSILFADYYMQSTFPTLPSFTAPETTALMGAGSKMPRLPQRMPFQRPAGRIAHDD